MKPTKSVSRLIGVLLFVQLAGLSLPFILLMPAVATGFLENAAGMAFQIKVAVFLLFANGALTIGIAIAAFAVFREHSYSMALWFLAFSIIWFSMQAVDNAHLLSMLSLSRQYAAGGAANAELFQTIGTAARSTRVWVHYTELLVIDTWFLLFYSLLFRFVLVPRALAGFGLIAVVLHTAGITLPMFLGYSSVMPMGFSLALSHLAVGTWLLVKGFKERVPSQAAV
ncbi:MAG: DUF4386 domain-containing protein [Pyrinomonadaceae bacterium]